MAIALATQWKWHRRSVPIDTKFGCHRALVQPFRPHRKNTFTAVMPNTITKALMNQVVIESAKKKNGDCNLQPSGIAKTANKK
jgi:hypothetical protein